jgi:hypothetical protein
MDPNQALADIIDAATSEDRDPEELIIAAEELVRWIRRGGFRPTDPRTPKGRR